MFSKDSIVRSQSTGLTSDNIPKGHRYFLRREFAETDMAADCQIKKVGGNRWRSLLPEPVNQRADDGHRNDVGDNREPEDKDHVWGWIGHFEPQCIL